MLLDPSSITALSVSAVSCGKSSHPSPRPLGPRFWVVFTVPRRPPELPLQSSHFLHSSELPVVGAKADPRAVQLVSLIKGSSFWQLSLQSCYHCSSGFGCQPATCFSPHNHNHRVSSDPIPPIRTCKRWYNLQQDLESDKELRWWVISRWPVISSPHVFRCIYVNAAGWHLSKNDQTVDFCKSL